MHVFSFSNKNANSFTRQTLCQWYQTALGRKLRRLEADYLRQSVLVPYSFRIVQLGYLGWEKQYLDSGYLPHFQVIDDNPQLKPQAPLVIGHLDSLPIASESVDLMILPHTFEYVADQHQLLREVERILKPEGQLLILGFYPWSFYRLYRWIPGKRQYAPLGGRLIGHNKLLDWLNLLNFTGELNASFDFHNLRYPYRSGFCQGRCTALWSVAYAVRAIKRTYHVIPLKTVPQPNLEWAPGMVEPTIQRKNDQ
ncbi:MAG TPA: class I SAM-dependent methyltransferase [Methylothermaceae bacterium]|nr:class I SAM-dependent methyltransferase [Methylothermaceae bacterium]